MNPSSIVLNYLRKAPGLRHFVSPFLIVMLLSMTGFSQSKRFTLLHTSDEHSVLMPLPSVDYHPEQKNPSLGGFARLSGLVQQIRAQKGEEPVLLLSSGDFIGGSPYAWLILEGYSPEIELMQKIGYDAVTIGNHEFDYGPDKLSSYLKRAGYPEAHEKLPLVISNLNIPQGHSLEDIQLLPSQIQKLENGLTIGILGLLGKTAYSVAPMAEPVTILDPVEVAQKQVDQLRAAGAQVVIALSHSGVEEDYLLARKVENIDVILGGHDHYQSTEATVINNTIIMHSSYYLQYVGMLELEYDTGTGQLRTLNHEHRNPFLLPLDHSVSEDPEIASLIASYTDKLNAFVTLFTDSMFTDVYEPVMRSDFVLEKHKPMAETTVGNFLVDAMRLQAQEVLGERVDLAIQANGVIRGNVVPGVMDWSRGKVSFMDLVTIAGLGSGPDMKAGYPMVSIYLTAEEIYTVFEIGSLLSLLMGDTYFLQISGMKYSYDPGKAIWMKIPFTQTPVPAYRSVKEVYLYKGAGVQDQENYKLLDKNSDRLYHLVADYYLTSFLPMIGEILPRLKLELKDKNGNLLELENTIIYDRGKEFKVWEAVARYAQSFAPDESGLPVMPQTYQSTQGRIQQVSGIPLYVWSYLGLAVFATGLGLLIRKAIRKIRKRLKRRDA